MKSFQLPFLLVGVLLIAAPVLCNGIAIVPGDRQALLDFKKGVADPLGRLRGWQAGAPCATWKGVQCTADGHVFRLLLPSSRLRGTISPSLGKLAFLQFLDLSANSFSGGIPATLGSAKRLQYLFLQSNSLSGSIPPTLGGLSRLQYLYLFSNELAGPIPSTFSKLSSLLSILMNSNQLSGQIPSGLGSLVDLRYLRVHANRLSGPIPSSLGAMRSLLQLYLGDNDFSGFMPSSLGNLAKLQHLYLQGNSLTGPVPSSFGNLQNLVLFHAYGNKLSGSIPSTLGKLVKLQTLSLYSNVLTGVIPPTLGNCKSLRILLLSGNHLSGPIPPSLGNIKYLQKLELKVNKLTGRIPLELGNLNYLETLDLFSNFLSGELSIALRSKSLTTVNLAKNYFSGSGRVTNLRAPFCPGKGKILGIETNCFTFNGATPSCSPRSTQRRPDDCSNFCGAYQYQGACGGNGQCEPTILQNRPKCNCALGYKTSLGNPFKCVFDASVTQLGGLLAFPSAPNPAHLSPWFQHASTGFTPSVDESPTWQVAQAWSWAAQFPVWPVKEQGRCSACWAFAPVAAMEAAYAITNALRVPPTISEQQLIDCEGTDSCRGGWPGDAFEYAATTPLFTNASYPYVARDVSRDCPVTQGQYKLARYEQVNFYGWFGLLLAVQQQPVVVNIQASSPAFINYDGSYIFDDSTCFTNGADHTLLVVGYDLTSFPQHWVLRNSWGPNWGAGGYMRMAIRGGDGVCGINVLPGFFPVFRKPRDPCNRRTFPSVILNNLNVGAPGSLNPCGGGLCRSVGGGSYTCQCEEPFVLNQDRAGAQTCVPAKPCSYFSNNPCGVGTCVDSRSGKYACVCPLGYALGTLALDNSTTCVPAAISRGLQTYTVPSGFSVSCRLLYQLYNIPKDRFAQQNKRLNCGPALAPGTVVNVTTSSPGCSVLYAVSQSDTCQSIQKRFKLSALGGAGSPNPDLDCSSQPPQPGQQVCVKLGNPPAAPLCTAPYTMAPGESCSSIIAQRFGGDAKQFFLLNPGIYCDRIFVTNSNDVPAIQVCLASTTIGAINLACKSKRGQSAKVKAGEGCLQLYQKYYKGKRVNFRKQNGYACQPNKLHVGATICI